MGFAFPAALLFGLVLIIASLSLFVVSKVKPNLYEESDSIYVVLGIVCGLLLLISLELSAAMAFQQLLLLSATITLMWRFINLRAENKQLKNRQSGGERPKAYNARLEDDYVETPRERRQGKRRRNVGYEDEERRLLGDSREVAAEPMLSRRRGRSFDADDTQSDRYDERRSANVSNRRADWDDETDWDDTPSPRTTRRALPDADRSSTRSERRSRRRDDISSDELEPRESRIDRAAVVENREPRRRDEQIATNDPDVSPRRRPRPQQERDDRGTRSERTRDAEGTMGSYVNYEPIDDPDDRPNEPPSGLPPSSSEPIVFPDRY
jgi:hypothetical protein